MLWVKDMNRDRLAGDWKNIKEKIKEKWGELNDDDLRVVGTRQVRDGYAKDQDEQEPFDYFDGPCCES